MPKYEAGPSRQIWRDGIPIASVDFVQGNLSPYQADRFAEQIVDALNVPEPVRMNRFLEAKALQRKLQEAAAAIGALFDPPEGEEPPGPPAPPVAPPVMVSLFDEPGRLQWHGELERFIADNRFAPDVEAALRAKIAAGETYHGGGGRDAMWRVMPMNSAETP